MCVSVLLLYVCVGACVCIGVSDVCNIRVVCVCMYGSEVCVSVRVCVFVTNSL